jgi:ATP-dependent protease ClpP protease subunit
MSATSFYTIRLRNAVASATLMAIGAAPVAAAPVAEIWIYADIGESWWDDTVSAKTLCKEIAALEVGQITVRINSFGGSVSDGIAIYNALKNHPAQVTTCVDGIGASVASLIFQAGDRREIAENAQLMVHAPWTYAAGNAPELRAAADMLDSWANSMAQTYSRASGKPADAVLAEWLDGKDHWMTAAEAVAAGLADEAVAAMPINASASRHTWAARINQPPAARAAAPSSQPAAAAAPLETDPMPQPTNPAAPADAQAIAAAAVRAENTRISEIRAAHKAYARNKPEADALLDKAISDSTMTLAAFKAELLEINAKGTEPLAGGYVVTTEDEGDKRRKAIRAALEIRAGLSANDSANPWRGHTLGEIARACLTHAGVRDIPGSKMDMIAQAFTHSSSDFPLLLANIANKAMMKGYDEADETFQTWTTAGSLPDFKVQSTVDLASFPSLRAVGAGGQYKYVTVGDRGESRVLATYGEIFGINRQTIINDDLDAFSRIPRKMGRAAIRTVGNLAYAVLTGNPSMADGQALFSAPHANLQTAAAPSTAAIDLMRVAMARQKDVGQDTGSLNIRMRYLIVPISLEGAAKVVRDSQVEVLSTTTKNNTVPNSVAGTFEVVSDARLDDASASIYYGAADPAMHDTVVVDYLDGNQAPTLEQQNGWSIDGVEFKVRMDAAAKALDWKTLQRNG